MSWRWSRVVSLALACGWAGCPKADILPEDAAVDAGRQDAGVRDASVADDAGGTDAGMAADDAGHLDAGIETDAGGRDAGVDAGAPAANLVFVSAQTVIPGMLGGLANADAFCNEQAMRAGLPDVGTYVAWLSTSTGAAIDRLRGSRGWRRVDGEPVVDTVEDLAAGRILASPRLDELGGEPLGAAATATLADGTRSPLGTCDDWRSTVGMLTAGISRDGTRRWTEAFPITCANRAPLYCFGTGRVSPISVATPAGRLAFRSEGRVRGEVSRDAIDGICGAEATRAGYGDRRFVALVATTAESATERLSDGEPWHRPDGVLVARTVEEIEMRALRAPVSVSADGAFYRDERVWGGATRPGERAVPTGNCDDWSSVAGTGHHGLSGASIEFFTGAATTCATPLPVLCFEP